MRSTLGWIATACMAVGPALAYARLIPGMIGFVLYVLGGLVALLVALVSVVQAARGRGLGSGAAVAVLAGATFVVIAARSAGVPAINDFTTDANDPPAFRHAQTLGPNVGRDLGYPPAFAETQRACCADLHPARLRVGREEAFAHVQRLAAGMPAWAVTQADPAAGSLEAVVTSRLFGFQDDVVIRVRPDGDTASHVDVRSKSRDGKGDLGVNAARIRDVVTRLETGS
jgi:uncharacterized protein (DUF1499 family)